MGVPGGEVRSGGGIGGWGLVRRWGLGGGVVWGGGVWRRWDLVRRWSGER